MEGKQIKEFIQYLVKIGFLAQSKANFIQKRIYTHAEQQKTLHYLLSDYLRNLKLTQCFQIVNNMQIHWLKQQIYVDLHDHNNANLYAHTPIIKPRYIPGNDNTPSSYERFMKIQNQLRNKSDKKDKVKPICLFSQRESQQKYKNKQQILTTNEKVIDQTINPQRLKQKKIKLSFNQLSNYQQKIIQNQNNPIKYDELQAIEYMKQIPRCKSYQTLPHQTPMANKKKVIFQRLYQQSKIRQSQLKKKQQLKNLKEQQQYNFRPTLIAKSPISKQKKYQDKSKSSQKKQLPNYLFKPGINKSIHNTHEKQKYHHFYTINKYSDSKNYLL